MIINYRPISCLSTLLELLEKITGLKLAAVFTNTIYKKHGFRHAKSTWIIH